MSTLPFGKPGEGLAPEGVEHKSETTWKHTWPRAWCKADTHIYVKSHPKNGKSSGKPSGKNDKGEQLQK